MTNGSESRDRPGEDRARKLSPRELVLLLPSLGKLLWRLGRDRRVPLGTKLLVIGTGVYLAIPVDVIPDWIPVLGYLDDALLVGFVLHRLLRTVPSEILREHWEGAISLHDLVQSLPIRSKKKDRGSDRGSPQCPSG